jgi:hypothetical protein
VARRPDVLKELPDDRAVNLVCKDASGQTWSTFADSGWGPDNLAEATAGAGQTSARGSRHESSRSTPSANECRFREQPRTTPAAPERTGRMPCSLPICGASSAAVTVMAPRADCHVMHNCCGAVARSRTRPYRRECALPWDRADHTV